MARTEAGASGGRHIPWGRGMSELSEAEHLVLDWIRQLATVAERNTRHTAAAGWRYRSPAELLLQRGRLFTPSPALAELGPAKACYRNASAYADSRDDALYVEGIAACALNLCLEHAWSAAGSAALDPTWPDGHAYLGLPLVDSYRQHRQERTGHHSLLWSPSVLDILRAGLPEDAIADVGRPVTPPSTSGLTQR